MHLCSEPQTQPYLFVLQKAVPLVKSAKYLYVVGIGSCAYSQLRTLTLFPQLSRQWKVVRLFPIRPALRASFMW